MPPKSKSKKSKGADASADSQPDTGPLMAQQDALAEDFEPPKPSKAKRKGGKARKPKAKAKAAQAQAGVRK